MFTKKVLMKLKIRIIIVTIVVLILFTVFGVFTHIFEHDYFTSFAYPYNGDVYTSVLQLRYNQTPDISPIYNPYTYKFLNINNRKCSTKRNLRLVYIVKSAIEHFNRRSVIRNTWGYEQRFSDVDIQTVFLLGVTTDINLQERVVVESKQYNDLVIADFHDTYFNNTIKTTMGLKWAVTYCSNSKFYMFVDDDYYISTKNVLRFIRNPSHYPHYLQESLNVDFDLSDEVRLYSGYVFFSSPHRHLTSKWYVSLDEYPYHLWPPYVTAGAYILSKEALLNIFYAGFYTKLFRFDDIYMGLLAKKVILEPFHCNEFYFYKKPYTVENYRFTVASHGYENPAELSHVWTEQKSKGNA